MCFEHIPCVSYFLAAVIKCRDQKQLMEERVYFGLWLQREVLKGWGWGGGEAGKLQLKTQWRGQTGNGVRL